MNRASFSLLISDFMSTSRARWQEHELVPVVSDRLSITRGVAACVILLEIVEDCFTWMMVTSIIGVLLFYKRLLGTAFICAIVSALLVRCRDLWLFLYHPRLLFGFLLLIEISYGFDLSRFCFIDTFLGVRYRLAFPKFSLLFLIAMRADATALDCLELVPVIYNSVAAVPSFLDVVEYRLARMESARLAIILFVGVGL